MLTDPLLFLDTILWKPENELVEFKLAEKWFSERKLWDYFSALSNEAYLHLKWSAYFILGIDPKSHLPINTTSWSGRNDLRDLKNQTHKDMDMSFREIYEVTKDGKRILIFEIPACPRWNPVASNGFYYARAWESLVALDLRKLDEIRNPKQWADWSGKACTGTTLSDLDDIAVTYLRDKKSEITNDESYHTLDIRSLLNQLSLLTEDGIPNNTCILFLWKQDIAERKLPAISRIIWLYVDEKNGFEDRINSDEQRSPLLLTIIRIIEKIKKYNFPLEDFTLFRPDPVYQYDEKAVEELIANSLAHRDWNIALPNDIRQTPHSLSFSNPGLFENDFEKVIEYSHVTPYKNQTMADFLSKINLMENERRWLQKVLQVQLSKWVFVIQEEIDNHAWGIVKITLDGKIRDKEFAKLVLSEKEISRMELFLLQKIASWAAILGKDIPLEQAELLHEKWYIEYYGRSPHRRARISYALLESIQQTEKYILNKWIWTRKKEKLILEYLDKKKQITTHEIYRLFPETNKNSLRTILKNMTDNHLIQRTQEGVYALS